MKSPYVFGRSALATFLLCAISALCAYSQECVDPDGSVELDAEIRSYERVLVLDQNSLETANKGLGAAQEALRQHDESLESLRNSVKTLEQSISQSEARIQEILVTGADLDTQEIQDQIDQMRKDLETARIDVVVSEYDRLALFKAVESADRDVTSFQQSIASLQELIAQKQAELAALYYCPAVEEPAEVPEEPVDPELETMPNI